MSENSLRFDFISDAQKHIDILEQRAPIAITTTLKD